MFIYIYIYIQQNPHTGMRLVAFMAFSPGAGVPTGGSLGCHPYFAHGDGTEHFSVSGVAPPCPTQCGNSNFGRAFGTTWAGEAWEKSMAKRKKDTNDSVFLHVYCGHMQNSRDV